MTIQDRIKAAQATRKQNDTYGKEASQGPGAARPSASVQSSPTPAVPTIPKLDLAGMSRDALEAGVLPATTQFGMLELPTGAAAERKGQRQTPQKIQREETAQRLDDLRRQELEAERRQLTLPGRVYNEETTAQNRARVQEIDQELSMLEPERSGRLKSGVQSILSSTLGAPFAIGETIAQMGRNAAAQANDPEYQSLSERYSQIMGRMAGLEQSYKGHEDYLYATPQWNELAQERDEVLASLRQRGTELDKPVDVTSDGMRLMRESNQYREQALEGLEGVPRFLGSTALSIGQNAALLPLAAVNPAASLAAMSAVSSADRMYELSERGLPASEALGRGLISGGIEAATEKIPLENLLSVVRTGGTSALRNILRQAGIEAGEESVSYMANYLADLAVQDPEARFSLAELAESAAGGALSGGVFGTGGTILNGLSNDYTFVPFSDLRITLPIRPGQNVVLPQGGERQSHIVEEAGPGGAETGGAGGYYAGQADAAADLSEPTAAASSATVQSPSTLQTQKTAPTREAGTGLIPLTEHVAENLSTGKNNIIARTFQDVVSFVKRARSQKGGPERLYMGTIPDSAAEQIRSQTGIDVSGYTAILPGSSVQHIIKNHGDPQSESARGQRAVTDEDIALVPRVLAEPDTVVLSDETDAFGRPVLLLSKQIGDTYITAQAVTDGRHMLATNSLWIQKKKNPLVTTSDASVSTDPAHNAQSVPPSGSSGTIISKDGREVNPENSGQMDRKRSSQQGIQIPVETRTWQDASNRKVNAFQYDHPELHPYYAEAAKVLQHELSQGTKGERFTLKDQDGYISGYTGSKRAQASPVEQALDNANLSYSDIDKALTAIINDQGQENYAAAKKMELVLDDMLSNGYTGADGMEYGPNESYLSARDAVNGGLPAESTEYRMGEEEWASLQASEPPESVYETGGQSDSLSVPADEYIPNPGAGPQYLTGPESSVGAAREEFDPWSHFQNQRSQFIPEGANAARPVDVPTTDPQGRRIRRTASTAMGAKAIPDEAVADIQNMVLRGELSYDRVTDKASIDRAIKTIEEKTYAGALEEFRSAVSKGVVSKDIATLGQQLLINAANAGDEKITAEMLSLYAQMETTAGQAVQAASILRKLSPTSQLYAAQRMVSDLEKTIRKNNENRENHMKLLTRKESQQVLNTVTDQGETALRLLTNIIELYAKQTPNKRTDLKTLVDRNPDFETYADDIDSFIKSEEESGWVSQLGMELARNASRRATDSTYTSPTFYQTILSDLTHFMENYVDKRPKTAAKRTAANRLTDYFQNRSEYTRAWIAAQSALREQYKESPFMLERLEDFLLNGIDYNAVGPDQIVGRAVADAAINEDVDLQKLLVRWNYDKDALVLQISSNLIQETGAEGADAIMIHDAVARHIYERVSNSGKDIQKLIDYNIRKSMKEIGVKLPNLIKEGKGNQKSTADTISNMLVQKYGISNEAAETFSNEVTKRFFAMVETSAHKKLEYMFKDKPQAKRRNIMERFTELVNLGAFLDPDFDAKAAQKLFGEVKIRIDSKLIERFSQQTDQAGRDKVLEEIYQNVADQIPANWRDKWNAWRYMAMLFNPRTHIRNIAGNVFFLPVRMTKDRVAAAIEAGVSAASGGQFQRTKSFVASPELYKAAWSDWANVKDVLSGNKYDDVRSEINSRRRIFRTAPLEAIRTGNSWLLEFEDSIFKQITYADALAGYLQANGVTAEQVRNNTVDAQIMSSARDYAGKEALKATYQDRNRVSDKAVEISRTIGPVGDAILPFKRTPANVLVRGVEYSPVGLARGLKNALWDVKRGKMTGAEAIDRIASGLTGTALFALGAALYSLGAVTSGGGDDENEDRLNDLIGKQNYALNLPGGVNVTLDWLAPAALPFFMGVELVDSLGRNGNTADSIVSALKSISDPMLELSMLQSLNDVIDSVSFSENKQGALAASALISYFTQAIPTIGGQIERSAESVRMSTYVDKNNPLFTDVQYALGRASARIPGYDFQQIPYIDAWGRDESSGPLILRTANSFINPSYTSITEVTPVDEEIRRLYNETGDGTVVPERPERTLTLDGGKINLTAEQYTKYATDRGQMRFSMLEDLFDRAEYAAMPATNRSAMVNDIYTFTDKVAKAEISDYVPDGWVEDVVDSGLDPVEYIIFRNMVSNISGEGKKDQIVAVIDSMDIPDAEKDRYYLTYGYSENTLGDTPWN